MPHIILDNASVEFPIYDAGHRSLRRTLVTMSVGGDIFQRDHRHLAVRALDGISLTIVEGDRIGLIGHNGAGKSTLLSVMAGLYFPTRGRASIEGRVAPLLNLGSMLDPEMTGYENIEHAAVLLQLPASRRRPLLDEVADFTELGGYLDLPVKSYSAGMQLRLAFTLMTSQHPDILLIDEVLGVGDNTFVAKAAKRMDDLRERTSIVVMASHNDAHLRRLCNKLIWLEHGRIRQFGPVAEVLEAYGAADAATVAPA